MEGYLALNKGIHQKAWETMQFTQKYLGAWERANTLLPGQQVEGEHWRLPEGSIIKINFDEVFDSQRQLSGSSIISRNSKKHWPFYRLSSKEGRGDSSELSLKDEKIQ
ncbi:hypothetical protein Gorai_002614, partial [Gossypium raimondii]|nr:hypothetical protein [Gossypium raimondii]